MWCQWKESYAAYCFCLSTLLLPFAFIIITEKIKGISERNFTTWKSSAGIKEFAAKTQPSHAINSSKFIPFHKMFIEFIFVGFPSLCSALVIIIMPASYIVMTKLYIKLNMTNIKHKVDIIHHIKNTNYFRFHPIQKWLRLSRRACR